MRPRLYFFLFAFAVLSVSVSAHGQALPTATEGLRLSAFGGFTGADVNIAGTQLLGATAGADVGVRSFFGLVPSLEVRGSYIAGGKTIANQKDILGGLRIERRIGHLRPYGDVLFGREELNYASPGFPNPTYSLLYTYSASNLLSYGGGVELDATEHWALRLDGQYQKYNVPVKVSGTALTIPLTAAIVYRFNFNHRVHYDGKMP